MPDPVLERIRGETFVALAATPAQASAIDHARAVLTAAFARRGAAVQIVAGERITLAGGSEVVPCLTVLGPGGRCRLVVEFTTESTDRYLLGPKRMAYGDGGTGELWIVDLGGRRVLQLAGGRGGALRWPPRSARGEDRLAPAWEPFVQVTARDLLGGFPPRSWDEAA